MDRHDAHAHASYLARDLRDLGATRARLLDLVGRDHAAARNLAGDELRAAYFTRTLHHLPPLRDLRLDLARSATALGQRLVSALTTRTGLAVVRGALDLVRSLTREDRDHGLGR